MDHDHQESPFVGNQVQFIRMLRRAGLPVVMTQTIAYLRALELVDVSRREHVFHASRSLLVTRAEDLPLFDAVFERFWSLHRKSAARANIKPRQRPAQEKGLLVKYYNAFRKNAERDPGGYETLKTILGVTDMAKFKKDWERYVLALR